MPLYCLTGVRHFVFPVIEIDNAHTVVRTIVNGYVPEAVTQ